MAALNVLSKWSLVSSIRQYVSWFLIYRLSNKYINWLCHIKRLHITVFDFRKMFFFMPWSVSCTRFLRKLLLIGIPSTFHAVERTLHPVEFTESTLYKFCCSTQAPTLHRAVQWSMRRNLRTLIPIVRLLCDHIYRSTILPSCHQGQSAMQRSSVAIFICKLR